MTENRINQCVNLLKDALYDIECGHVSYAESLIRATVEALEEALEK